jgi:antitoxin (DNA-binding transcriptional repressor) of toxin-antitoxin stability system
MSTVQINATEAARNLSEILERVKYQGQCFEIKRGREIVARIVPAGAPRSLEIVDLGRFFDTLPPLSEPERRSFRKDLRALRKRVPKPRNPWD